MKDFHEVHCAAQSPPAVLVALKKDIHDAFLAIVGRRLHFRQELARKPSPSRITLTADFRHLVGRKSLAIRRLDFALQDGTVFKNGVPENQILDHGSIDVGQFIDLENLAEITIGGELRFKAVDPLTTTNMV